MSKLLHSTHSSVKHVGSPVSLTDDTKKSINNSGTKMFLPFPGNMNPGFGDSIGTTSMEIATCLTVGKQTRDLMHQF